MFKQIGMTTVELLIGLAVTSSATYFTLEMTEEAEIRIAEYQQATDVKKIMQKIRGPRQQPAIQTASEHP